MRFSDSTYRSLVVLNTVVLFFVVLGGLVYVTIKKDSFERRFRNLLDKERAASVLGSTSENVEPAQQIAIPVYDLKIKPAAVRAIDAQVQKLIEAGIYTDDLKVWHPARFFRNGEEYRVKIRLRGDLGSHWEGPKKSWRIRFPKDKLFEGRRYLDIIIPRDKNYELEPICYRVARELGLLVPDAGFCRVRINGVDFGLYLWMEKYGKEMLEKQGYPEGEIFRQRNVWPQTRFNGFGIFPDYYTSSFDSTIREDPTLGFYAERWDKLVTLIREADDDSFRREIPHLVDIDKYLPWNALTWLLGTTHSHWGDNLRWYYDNTSGLFQPILYDVNRSSIRLTPPEDTRQWPRWSFESHEQDRLAIRIMQVSEYRHRRNEILWTLLTEDRYDLARLSEDYFPNIRPGLLVGVGARSADEIDETHGDTQRILRANRKDLRDHLLFARLFT